MIVAEPARLPVRTPVLHFVARGVQIHDLLGPSVNTEMISQWELRAYTSPIKPHRRFLILEDKSIITCGLSLNNINKDEALERIPLADELADYDRDFFDNYWVSATQV